MASSDNLMTMIEQPWSFRTTFSDSWGNVSDTFFTKETEALTQALHRTISEDSPLSHDESDNNFLLPLETFDSDTSFLAPADSEGRASPVKKRKTGEGPSGGIRTTKKRKTRASKRQTTTFIAADPANFREMVQQVTGVRFGVGGGLGAGELASMVRPEPQMGGLLPANFFLGGSVVSAPAATLVQPRQAQAGVDFDSLCSFPTLESSKVQF